MKENTPMIKEENKIMATLIPILIGVLFTLIGAIYLNLKQTDAVAESSIADIQSHQDSDASRFQNLESNVYLLCKSQKLNCIPPDFSKVTALK